VLDNFLNTSRGKVNNMKSQIYVLNISKEQLHAISRILGIPSVESWTTFKYLGMAISLVNPTTQLW